MLCVRMSSRFVRSSSSMSSLSSIRVLLCDNVQTFRALVRCSLDKEDGIRVVATVRGVHAAAV